MAGLPEVIGLLYRADWTRLSLSAEVRSETDRNLLPPLSPDEPSRWYRPRPAQTQEEEWSRWHRAWPAQQQDGRYSWRGTLLIGPGGRWRLAGSVPGRDAGAGDDQRHTDVGLERGLLAGIEPVLAHVVAVVGAEDDVRVVRQASRPQHRLQVGDQVVDGAELVEFEGATA